MGRMPSAYRKTQLQTLNDRHHEILRLLLLGYSSKQVSAALGVTRETVNNARNSIVGKQQMALLQGARNHSAVSVAESLRTDAGEYYSLARDLIRDENTPAQTRLRYSIEMLGLAGYVKPQHVKFQGAVTHLTLDEIEEIKARARSAGTIIDAEYSEAADTKEGASPRQLLALDGEVQDQDQECHLDAGSRCAQQDD